MGPWRIEDPAPHGWRYAPASRSGDVRWRISLVRRGSRARGLPHLALTARQWRGYQGGSRSRAAAAATMRSRIGRRLHLAEKRAHQRRDSCQPTQRGTCPLNPRRHRSRGDGLATPLVTLSPDPKPDHLANHHHWEMDIAGKSTSVVDLNVHPSARAQRQDRTFALGDKACMTMR